MSDTAGLPTREALDGVLLADRPVLAELLRRVRSAARAGRPHDRNLRRLQELLDRSTHARAARASSVPAPRYPAELPIAARRDEILAALRSHQVVVVCGETGSGKSTQLPKLLLEAGCGVAGTIGHTQPRRLAARALAARLADELDVTLGEQVGFKVRFGDQTGERTLVKLMTDGVLLAETRGDPELRAYDALILDEAHERSLNVDFLLGYLRRLLPRRPELKLVVTSATIDPARFAAHFARDGVPAPIIEVSGRGFPVELRWRPLPPGADEAEPSDDELLAAVGAALDEVAAEGPGDVLVFLPTERLIHEAARRLRGRPVPGPRLEVLPLYARLPPEVQARLFKPHAGRRVVLATNVAETSLTVPGIRAVIDTGTARVSRWSPRSRLQRLPIEPIAQASAEQRKGRCGRVGPGLCLRLYDEADFAERPAQPMPEIQRANLAAVLLAMADLDLGDVADFPFLDPPRRTSLDEGRRTLRELGAFDEYDALTSDGRLLARLPVDPRIGRMLLSAHREGCLADLLIIAAALETADPRERPPGREKAARSAHGRLLDGESDFLSALRLHDHVLALREGKSRSQWEAALREEFLSPARVREWFDVLGQLRQLCAEAGLVAASRHGERHAIHRALLSGLLSSVACRKDGTSSEYQGADGRPLWIWPGSALFDKRPRWIMAAELVETSRRFARTVARVDPALIEELAGPLLQRSYHDPWWDRKSGQVLAHEKVLLHGLPLVPRRRARYERVEPVICRELFLRHGLAEGELDTDAPFLKHNLALANELAALEARTRRPGLLANLDARYDFYDRLVPPEVTGSDSFQRWRRLAEKHDRRLLFMSRGDLLAAEPGPVDGPSHPDELCLGGVTAPLRYRLAPGADDDGVTAVLRVDDLPRIDAARLTWLVPGLLRGKLIALLRGLPKELRRELLPIPVRVDEVLALLEPREGSLPEALARAVGRLLGRSLAAPDFDESRLPADLRLRLEVLDEQGRLLAAGRDLLELRRSLLDPPAGSGTAGTPGSPASAREHPPVDGRWHRDGLLRWDFGALPESVVLPDGRHAFPALVDQGGAAGLRLLRTAGAAAEATRGGVRRLLVLSLGGALTQRLQRRPEWTGLLLAHAALPGDLGATCCERLVGEAQAVAEGDEEQPAVRDALAYGALLARTREALPAQIETWLPRLVPVLAAAQRVRHAIDALDGTPLATLAGDLSERLAALLPADWLLATPSGRIPHLPRYLEALLRRLERARQRGLAADAELAARLRPWDEALAQLRRAQDERPAPPALLALAWQIEEYRVSVFAQELGTEGKVSPQRLEKLLAAARAELAN